MSLLRKLAGLEESIKNKPREEKIKRKNKIRQEDIHEESDWKEGIDKETLDLMKEVDNKKKGKISWFSYVWTIVVNLIILLAVIGIFNKAYTSTDAIIYALLILIILALWNFSERYKLSTLAIRYELGEQIDDTVAILSDNKKQITYWKEKKKELEEGLEQYLKKQWINGIFAFIIYIYVLLKLISSI